jgi:hypothetical protein
MSNLETRRLSFYKRDSFVASLLAMTDSLSVIAGMGKVFGNGEGIKSKNSDWEIKSNSFLIEGEKRRYRVCKKKFHNLER